MPPIEVQLVICGAGPLRDVSTLITQVLARGWKIQAIATPSALDIGLDVQAVELQTGRPVVTSAAIHLNTITKLALDIRDTYVAAVLGQAVAARKPMVILPSIKKVDLERRVFRTHIRNLRSEGVQVLIGGTNGLQPTNASSKDGPLPPFPWHLAVSAVEASIDADRRDSSLVSKFGDKMGVLPMWLAILTASTAIMVFVRSGK
ncbi:hypothetical protein B0H14DRAFT_3040731 [Mycena olivaceomarginata]|nr:hypothetical protein B0H14DRAFT_3040731 [Mycena olivaceomarginata]